MGFQPFLQEDVLLHPLTQKGKMMLKDSSHGGRAVLMVGPPALCSQCDKDGVHCSEVKMGRYALCVLCGSPTYPEGSIRRGSEARSPRTLIRDTSDSPRHFRQLQHRDTES